MRSAGEALFAEVCAVIDAEHSGTVVRPLAVTLLLGHRTGTRPPSAPPSPVDRVPRDATS